MGKSKKHKKKNNPGPKRLRYNRSARLANTKKFINQYNGKYVVNGYAKYFGVLCALKELEMHGYNFSNTYKQQLKDKELHKQHMAEVRKQKRRQKRERKIDEEESDETFAYIAGATDGGAAFGITWEEMEEISIEEILDSSQKELTTLTIIYDDEHMDEYFEGLISDQMMKNCRGRFGTGEKF